MADKVEDIKNAVARGLGHSEETKTGATAIADEAGIIGGTTAADIRQEINDLIQRMQDVKVSSLSVLENYAAETRTAANQAQTAYRVLNGTSSETGRELYRTSRELAQTADQFSPFGSLERLCEAVLKSLATVNENVDKLAVYANIVSNNAQGIAARAQADVSRAETYLTET